MVNGSCLMAEGSQAGALAGLPWAMSHEPLTINNRLINKLWDSKFQDSKIPSFLDSQTPKYQNFKSPRFQVPRFQSLKLPSYQDSKMSRLQDSKFQSSDSPIFKVSNFNRMCYKKNTFRDVNFPCCFKVIRYIKIQT